MSELQKVFDYQGAVIRTIVIDAQPWFVAADVCQVLDLNNSSQALSRLDEDEKGIYSNDTPGGVQEMLHVNEPGLYSLILTSRKPEAKQFKRWITHEIIPQIRRTGTYSVQPKSQLDALRQTVEILAEQERRLDKLEASQEHIKTTLVTQPQNWRQDINRMFNLVVDRVGQGKFAELRRQSYKRLEERARVDLDRRLINLKARLSLEGVPRSTIDRTNRMDVIEADPKLREIYASIIKEYTISYVS